MANQPFQFKQFTVHQDRCAMKIGTDGVLLGAWTSIDNQPQSILDLGAGTGVIALQMAQRSDAPTIDAVEIDTDAYEQCTENFENSPWGDRLFCYHASAQEFAMEIEEKYDLIVSNPPFYSDEFPAEDAARKKARFTESLPFDHLIGCVVHLLSYNGRFVVIIPFKEESAFIHLAQQTDLYPKRICRVKGHEGAAVKRSLMEFSFAGAVVEESELIIEMARHSYTQDYINLVKDFYLKM